MPIGSAIFCRRETRGDKGQLIGCRFSLRVWQFGNYEIMVRIIAYLPLAVTRVVRPKYSQSHNTDVECNPNIPTIAIKCRLYSTFPSCTKTNPARIMAFTYQQSVFCAQSRQTQAMQHRRPNAPVSAGKIRPRQPIWDSRQEKIPQRKN